MNHGVHCSYCGVTSPVRDTIPERCPACRRPLDGGGNIGIASSPPAAPPVDLLKRSIEVREEHVEAPADDSPAKEEEFDHGVCNREDWMRMVSVLRILMSNPLDMIKFARENNVKLKGSASPDPGDWGYQELVTALARYGLDSKR